MSCCKHLTWSLMTIQLAVFLILSFQSEQVNSVHIGSARASKSQTSSKDGKFRTPTLLVSLDGFRADKLDAFLRDHPDSTLQKEFVEKGLKADYMMPSFPTLTFPNHHTMISMTLLAIRFTILITI